jgi:hypothetical protein
LAIRLSSARAIAPGSQLTRELVACQRSSSRLPRSAAGWRQRPTAPSTSRRGSTSSLRGAPGSPLLSPTRRPPGERQRLNRAAQLVRRPVEQLAPAAGGDPDPDPVGRQHRRADERQRPREGAGIRERLEHPRRARRSTCSQRPSS